MFSLCSVMLSGLLFRELVFTPRYCREVRAGAGEGGQTLFVSHRQTVGAEAGVQTCKRCLRVLGIESTSTCTCTIKTLSINNLLKANHTNKIQCKPQ